MSESKEIKMIDATLHDYFVAQALNGYLSRTVDHQIPMTPDQIVEEAFVYADAAMKRRKLNKSGE